MKSINNHTLTMGQLNEITKIERFQGAFEATKFQRPALINGLRKTTIITSSGSSTRIEGAILTDAQVEELLEKGCQITKVSSRSEREVAGYIQALTYIYENYHQLSITQKNIREIHAILTSDLTEDQLPKKQRGTYKDVTNDVIEKNLETGEVKVWFRTTPPGPATATAMNELIADYQEITEGELSHPLVLIAGFIVHFLAIHPFRDGNGRLSRLLTSLLLLRHGYTWSQFASHEKIIEDNKEGYYISLRETQSSLKSDQIEYDRWFDFFLKIVSSQTEILQSKIVQESPISMMNENEKTVYNIIKSNEKCKVAFLLSQTDLSRPGLKSLLKRLVESGVIKKEGLGKATVYKV